MTINFKLNQMKNLRPKAEITCNIDKSNTKTNQLVYCSQLYGTFFAVGAKLKVKKGKLKSMRLTLINFKGLYNIGMLNKTRNAFEFDGGKATITLYLKANAGKHGTKKGKQIEVDCDNVPLKDIKSLDVTRELQRMSLKTYQEHLDEGFFDSEFYQRDGSLILDLSRLDDVPELTPEDRCKTTTSNVV